MLRTAPALVAGLLLLGACTAPAASPPVPSASPATVVSIQQKTTAVPDAPAPDYTGPLPLPAADGKPVLWPAPTQVAVESGMFGATTRYGFVDATGALVVPHRYEGYDYCRDEGGRVASIVVTAAARKAAVLDLAGTVIRTLPTGAASCGPPGTAVFTHDAPMDDSRWSSGLMQIATGRVLVPRVPGRHIQVVNDRTVNVSDGEREYFLDVVTGKRFAHRGEVVEPAPEPGAPGVPTVDTAPGGEGLTGYMDASGKWAIAPVFMDAFAFVQGFALVKLAEDSFTFIDTSGRRVGGEWSEVEFEAYEEGDLWQSVGYIVTGSEGHGLLALDLRTVVEPGPAEITCDSDTAGACAVVAPDGRATLVQMPQGTVTAMPDGFDSAVGTAFLGGGGRVDNTRILALDTGQVTDLGGEYSCQGAGPAWAACEPDAGTMPYVVLDTQGRRTVFRTMAPIYGVGTPAGVAWYWATTARYEGIVDAEGNWHYRQSRYTHLDD